MGAKKGNKNGRGAKGRSGRKSAFQEKMDANFLWELFLNEHSTEEIKKKLRSGKFSIKDVWVSKLVGGNERLLGELIKKLFPDNVKIEEEDKTIKVIFENSNGSKVTRATGKTTKSIIDNI